MSETREPLWDAVHAELHVDLIDNVWLAGYQELVERIAPDDPRADRHGDYRFASEPHPMGACPFLTVDRIPFRFGTRPGSLRTGNETP